MGASGAGKTTFVNMLCARLEPSNTTRQSGLVKINGAPVEPAILREHIGFVPQQDTLLPTATVREAIRFAADLRFPVSVDQKSRTEGVERILSTLGLQDVANSYIGDERLRGVSGGERKRVSIGVELVTKPGLLVLDEPTSGLDSFTAVQVVKHLQQLAANGHSVLCIIHQPSSSLFECFDNTIFLSRGHIVYNGPRAGAVDFFADAGYKCPMYVNPADYFMEVMNQDMHDDAVLEKFVEKQHKMLEVAPSPHELKRVTSPLTSQRAKEEYPGFFTQLTHLSVRGWRNYVRQPLLIRVRIAQTVIQALLIGLLFRDMGTSGESAVQNRNGVLFISITGNFMTSSLSVVTTFPLERSLFFRERRTDMYSTGAYFVSKFASEFFFNSLVPLIFCLIVYFLVGLKDTAEAFFIFYAANLLMSHAAQSTGLLIGSAVPNAEAAVSLAPVTIVPLMLFAGLFINSGSVPPYFIWLQYISPFKYAYEIVAINEYDNLDLNAPSCVSMPSVPCGNLILNQLDIDTDDLTQNFFILFSLFLLFRVAAFLVLWQKSRKA
jgi:ABC-type multidrug transport system ATPase subunit